MKYIKFLILSIIIFLSALLFVKTVKQNKQELQPPQFDKKEIQILYRNTVEYCKQKPFRTTGEILGCHLEYMEKYNLKLEQDYEKIRNYCWAISDTTFDTWECVDNMILK